MKEYKLSDQVRISGEGSLCETCSAFWPDRLFDQGANVLDDLAPLGFPTNNTPQVCNALRSDKFLRENGLEITAVDGPPSKLSTTVVVHYRAVGA